MILLVIISLLAGALLGLRFKVLILVPAIIFTFISTLGLGIGHGDGIWSILLAIVFAVTAVQMGYLGGTFTGFIIPGHRIYTGLPGPAAAQGPAR